MLPRRELTMLPARRWTPTIRNVRPRQRRAGLARHRAAPRRRTCREPGQARRATGPRRADLAGAAPAVARRGADLLDRKLRILQGELDGLRAAAAPDGREWERLPAPTLELWLLRGALLGGQRAIRLASDGRRLAEVTVSYASDHGRAAPGRRRQRAPPSAATWDGPGVAGRARRIRRGARGRCPACGARRAAVQVIEAEAAATRYRLRASGTAGSRVLSRRWPR